ncbi:MAG: hypothetical protein JO371_10615 [Paraburkholderia sp.]|nr:hypothetical protein [Paraburkholderia sp.]
MNTFIASIRSIFILPDESRELLGVHGLAAQVMPAPMIPVRGFGAILLLTGAKPAGDWPVSAVVNACASV